MLEVSEMSRIEASAEFVELTRQRNAFSTVLTLVVLALYFGFIGLVAFNKPLLAKPLGTGPMSIGIPIGIGLIVATVALTGLYVWRANAKFDPLVETIQRKAGE